MKANVEEGLPERRRAGRARDLLLIRNVREKKGRCVVVPVYGERPLHPDSSLVPIEVPPAQGARPSSLPDATNRFIVGVEGKIYREVVIVQRRERRLDGIEPHKTGISDGNRLHWTNGRAG